MLSSTSKLTFDTVDYGLLLRELERLSINNPLFDCVHSSLIDKNCHSIAVCLPYPISCLVSPKEVIIAFYSLFYLLIRSLGESLMQNFFF